MDLDCSRGSRNLLRRKARLGVSQTNVILLVVAIAWVVFITQRGDLPKWMQVVGL